MKNNLKNSIQTKILSTSLYEEIFFSSLLESECEKANILLKIMKKDLEVSASPFKENSEFNSFGVPEDFVDKISYSELFKAFAKENLLIVGLYRGKDLEIIPEPNEILKVAISNLCSIIIKYYREMIR